VDVKQFLEPETLKKIAVGAARSSLPSLVATGVLGGFAVLLEIELDVGTLFALFSGASFGNLIGQFQDDPSEALDAMKTLFRDADL